MFWSLVTQSSTVHHWWGGDFEFSVSCPFCLYQIWRSTYVFQSKPLCQGLSHSNPCLISKSASWYKYIFHDQHLFISNLVSFLCFCASVALMIPSLHLPCVIHSPSPNTFIIFPEKFSLGILAKRASYPKHLAKLLTFYMSCITQCVSIFSPCNYKGWSSSVARLVLCMLIWFIFQLADLKTMVWLCIFLQLAQMQTNFSPCVC